MRDKKRKRKKEGDRMRRRDRRRQKPGVEDVGEKGGRRNCVCYSELTVCCGAERQWQTRITHMHAHMQWHTNMREQDYDLKHTVASSSPPPQQTSTHTKHTHARLSRNASFDLRCSLTYSKQMIFNEVVTEKTHPFTPSLLDLLFSDSEVWKWASVQMVQNVLGWI